MPGFNFSNSARLSQSRTKKIFSDIKFLNFQIDPKHSSHQRLTLKGERIPQSLIRCRGRESSLFTLRVSLSPLKEKLLSNTNAVHSCTLQKTESKAREMGCHPLPLTSSHYQSPQTTCKKILGKLKHRMGDRNEDTKGN